METSQAAAHSGRPRQSPATATAAATSTQRTAQAATIDAIVESLARRGSISLSDRLLAGHMAVAVLRVIGPAKEHRADHACPHRNAHPATCNSDGCAARNQPEQRPTEENRAGNGHRPTHLCRALPAVPAYEHEGGHRQDHRGYHHQREGLWRPSVKITLSHR